MEQKAQANARFSSKKKFDVRTMTMVGVLLVLWIIFTALTSQGFTNMGSSFISARNLSNLMRQMAIVGIMASTMSLIIVTTGIDLSAGSVVGFVGCIGAWLQVYSGMGTPATIAICIVMSIGIYVLQGSIIAYAGLAPFIVTLGGQLVFRGLILAVTKGATIAPLKESLLFFGQAYLTKVASYAFGIVLCALLLFNEMRSRASKKKHGSLTDSFQKSIIRWVAASVLIMLFVTILNMYKGMPVPVLIMLIIVIIVGMIADKTSFGRSIYAIGGNLDAAKYSGIDVKRNLVLLYSLHGVMIGVAGLILAARLNAGSATSGKDMELDAIASAVIGGTSMSGGVGKPAGAILGACIMASIDNGMSMMNMDAYWQYIVKGLILVGAVWFDIKTRAKKKS